MEDGSQVESREYGGASNVDARGVFLRELLLRMAAGGRRGTSFRAFHMVVACLGNGRSVGRSRSQWLAAKEEFDGEVQVTA